MRILVDTNVYLDFFLEREGFNEAKEFFLNCRLAKCKTFVTSMSLRDIEYVAHRKKKNKQESMRILNAVYSLCTKVLDVTADDAINAMFSDFDDYEDGMIAFSAERSMMNLIISNNVDDFRHSTIPIWTPKEFNDVIRREKYR